MKRCSACEETKALSEFNKNRAVRDGHNAWCRQCCKDYNKANKEKRAKKRTEYRKRNKEKVATQLRVYAKKNKEKISACKARWYRENKEKECARSRASNLARNFGITIEQYDKMLDAQNNGCAICGKSQEQNAGGNRLAVDHNHETGEVRGLLCRNCNVAIGFMNDDPSLFSKAIQYLNGDRHKMESVCNG